VRVTHRFHPLFGREFEFVVHRHNWAEDRGLLSPFWFCHPPFTSTEFAPCRIVERSPA
jgi:hypothetical protein